VTPQIGPREICAAFHPGTIVPTYGAGRAGAEITEKGHFWMETKAHSMPKHSHFVNKNHDFTAKSSASTSKVRIGAKKSDLKSTAQALKKSADEIQKDY
jgi:hypothetical protein